MSGQNFVDLEILHKIAQEILSDDVIDQAKVDELANRMSLMQKTSSHKTPDEKKYFKRLAHL